MDVQKQKTCLYLFRKYINITRRNISILIFFLKKIDVFLFIFQYFYID